MLENTASLVHLLSTVCETKHFIFLPFCKFEWMTSSVENNSCPFDKNKSLIQKSERFDLFRLVLFMSTKFQVFIDLGEKTNLKML